MSLRISNVVNAYDVYSISRPNQVYRMTRAEEKRDMVALSSQARDYQKVYAALKNVSDIRVDKVADIQRRMEAGEYNINSYDIADKMLSDF